MHQTQKPTGLKGPDWVTPTPLKITCSAAPAEAFLVPPKARMPITKTVKIMGSMSRLDLLAIIVSFRLLTRANA
jgi:hypothetical protein